MLGMNTGFEGIRRRHDTAVFEKHVLSNGIEVWLQNPPILTDDEGILMVFLGGIGSIMDPKGSFGAAHFFEHLPFQGTGKYPRPDEGYRKILDLGGYLNAHTGARVTWYDSNVPKDCLEEAVEVIFSMVTEPKLDEKVVETERGVIEGEYRKHFSNSNKYKGIILSQNIFGPDHPLSHSVLGDVQSIRNMKADVLRDFHAEHYHAGNMSIICGGAFKERKDTIQILEKYFGSLERKPKTSINLDLSAGIEKQGQRIVINDKRLTRDYLHIEYNMMPQAASADYALYSLAETLGSDMRSPLVEELRQKRGWIYECGLCSATMNNETWSFGADLPVSKEHFKEAEEIFYEVLRNLKEEDILTQQKREQLSRSRDFQDSLDSCTSAMSEIMNWGRIFTWNESERERDEVTLERVYSWRDYLLKNKPLIIEVHGNIETD